MCKTDFQKTGFGVCVIENNDDKKMLFTETFQDLEILTMYDIMKPNFRLQRLVRSSSVVL